MRLLHGRPLWGLRLAVVFAAPAAFLLLLEGILALFHVGYPTSFFVPSEQPGVVTTNSHFGWHYQQQTFTEPHPCLISVEKPKDMVRIFVLGESAAMGTPDPSFGFARILEIMLRPYLPGHRLEVVNAAMRGINSHLISRIARECADLHPDLFIVYMGNNELIGLYGPKTPVGFFGRHPRLIPAFHFLKQRHTARLLRQVLGVNPEVRQRRPPTRTAAFFQERYTALDDPEREHAYRNFRHNFERVCRHGLDAGADVIVSTIAVNLRDFPPLGSLHRIDLSPTQRAQWEEIYQRGIACESMGDVVPATAAYEQAAAIDDHYAELHYRLARCHLRAGARDAAAAAFTLARDWDALQFRADTRLNTIIRDVAGRLDGGWRMADGGLKRATASDAQPVPFAASPIQLVDAEAVLAASDRCPDGIPGQEFFYEYVHLRFPGDYEVAKALLPAVIRSLGQRGLKLSEASTNPPSAIRHPQFDASQVPSREQCARELAFTRWDEVNTAAAMLKMTANLPFTAQLDHAQRQASGQKAVAAVTDHIDDPFIDEVIRRYREALAARPQDWCLHYNLGVFLQQLERPQEAAAHFHYVVRALPHVPAFHVLLGQTWISMGRLDEATRELREALKRHPSYQPAREGLSRIRAARKHVAGSR